MKPNPYQAILQKTHEEHIPFAAHVELTYRCNLNCIHCYATNRSIRNELTTEEVEDVLKQLSDMGCLFLTLTGGEILCRNDIKRIMETARNLRYAIHLLTNGTLMTAELADAIAKIEPVSVDMSLYSVDPATHDAITGVEGSHQKTTAALLLCRERGINVNMKAILMKSNVNGYGALRAFAETIGARIIVDFVLAPTDDGGRPMDQYGLSEDEIFDFIRANSEPPSGVERFEVNSPALTEPLCGAGNNAICVTPIGDVLPCLAIRNPIGNIRNHPLREIWSLSSLDKVRGLRYYSLAECRECGLLSRCSRCSGVAFAECGSLEAKSESACLVARATRRAVECYTRNSERKSS